MRLKYDLHIHSALSPCAENEMTPNNIVNMAYVNRLDLIAVTDHNSAGNLRTISKLAKERGIIFLPGIEVESSEEVHIVTLFPDVEKAEIFGDMLRLHLCGKRNIPDIFGDQYLFDVNDEVIAEESQLLLFSTDLPASAIFSCVNELGGIAYFAHVDRKANGVLALLGDFPNEIPSSIVEVSDNSFKDERLDGKYIIYSSDAHCLRNMNRGEYFIDVPDEYTDSGHIISYLKDLHK